MSIILSYFEKKEKRICSEIEEYIETDEIVNIDNDENNIEIDNKHLSKTIVVESIESLSSKTYSSNKNIGSMSNKIDSSNKGSSELPQLSPYSIVDDDII